MPTSRQIKAGIKQARAAGNARYVSDADVRRIHALGRAGYSVRRIAKLTGHSHGTVQRYRGSVGKHPAYVHDRADCVTIILAALYKELAYCLPPAGWWKNQFYNRMVMVVYDRNLTDGWGKYQRREKMRVSSLLRRIEEWKHQARHSTTEDRSQVTCPYCLWCPESSK